MAKRAQGTQLTPPTGGTGEGVGQPTPSPGGATATMYGPFHAMAEPATVVLAADAHPSRWWVAAGLGGTAAAVLRITYTPVPGGRPRLVYVFDGDGSGTAKFLRAGGSAAYGHMEVEVQG